MPTAKSSTPQLQTDDTPRKPQTCAANAAAQPTDEERDAATPDPYDNVACTD